MSSQDFDDSRDLLQVAICSLEQLLDKRQIPESVAEGGEDEGDFPEDDEPEDEEQNEVAGDEEKTVFDKKICFIIEQLKLAPKQPKGRRKSNDLLAWSLLLKNAGPRASLSSKPSLTTNSSY
jgi:hypothetical protein